MSQTTIDSYLAAQTAPINDLTVDPKYHNIRMVTPIGRFAYIHVDAPFAIPSRDPNQPSRPMYSATLMMAPGTAEAPIVADLHKAAAAVADAHWPAIQRPDPNNPSSIITVPGSHLFWTDSMQGGLHYPLRKGDDNYMKDPQKFGLWRGLWFINCGMAPKTKSGADQRPAVLDEKGTPCDPKLFYPGCYGRMQVTVSAYDTAGNRGVTYYLNAVQFARHGEKMQTFDAGGFAQNAFAKAGAITGDPGAPPIGFGANTAAGAQPPGVPPGTPFGFAAPPPAGQPAAAANPPAGFAAPSPAATQPGFRPPGV
jgi:hypothetical protein